MRSTKAVRTAKIGYIALSAALCALGLLLILKPGLSIALTGAVVGEPRYRAAAQAIGDGFRRCGGAKAAAEYILSFASDIDDMRDNYDFSHGMRNPYINRK